MTQSLTARGVALVTLTLIATYGIATAETTTSLSTSTAPRDCRGQASARDDSGARICAGPQGLKVLIREGDLRETVSIGRSRQMAAVEPAGSQSFGPFNATSHTIEWRLANGKPFAAIQRWHIADNDDAGPDHRPRTKQLLVVTRVMPKGICHVAYIDVTANPEADRVARDAATRLARNFDCAKDRIAMVGTPGRATELASPR